MIRIHRGFFRIFLSSLLGLVFILCSLRASALEVKEVWVLVELPGDTAKACQLSEDSIAAEVESAVRSNGIKVKGDADLSVPFIYANLQGVDYRSHCNGHAYLQIGTHLRRQKVPWTEARLEGKFEHCIRTFSFTNGQKGYELQQAVNATFGDHTKQCISEVLKK